MAVPKKQKSRRLVRKKKQKTIINNITKLKNNSLLNFFRIKINTSF